MKPTNWYVDKGFDGPCKVIALTRSDEGHKMHSLQISYSTSIYVSFEKIKLD